MIALARPRPVLARARRQSFRRRRPRRDVARRGRPAMTRDVLAIRNLSVLLPPGLDRGKAVDGIDLDLRRGEIHCVVGESGSGKSMLSYSVMGLLPPGLSATGSITFAERDLLRLGEREMRDIRGSKISMIFQEPMTALNPAYTIANQVCEVYRTHTTASWRDAHAQAEQDLESVGLPDVARMMASYPHQLSGGQRQRVMIAMALALGPSVLIADEPTTALDVTTQAQILNLIRRLQRDRDTGVLFITHDFGVVAEIADRVTVMPARGDRRDGRHRRRPAAPAGALHEGADRRRPAAAPATGQRTIRSHRAGRLRSHQDPCRTRTVLRQAAPGRRAEERLVRAARRRDPGDRRRVRLGQVDPGALPRPARSHGCGHDVRRGRGRGRRARCRPSFDAPDHPDGLSGSLRFARWAPTRRRHPLRRPAELRAWHGRPRAPRPATWSAAWAFPSRRSSVTRMSSRAASASASASPAPSRSAPRSWWRTRLSRHSTCPCRSGSSRC